MRSTRATAAVARLNRRSEGRQFRMAILAGNLFELREQLESGEQAVSGPLELDDFVSFVDAQGPQKAPKLSKNDLAFARQLVRKPPR